MGYSEHTLKDIAADADASYQPPYVQVQRPNIIMIMNEGWAELNVLGNLEVTTPYMSYVESMDENTIKGMLTVNIFGGITANTEFEEFVDINIFQTEYGYVRGYISDECNFNEIIWQFEHKREDTPLFLFDVTIQNHGGFEGITSPVSVEKVGSQSPDTVDGMEQVTGYLNLINITDNSFAALIEYFETVEEPVIFCMFGDHQPALGDSFYEAIFADRELSAQEQENLKYIVPYVIWTNYDTELPEYGDMSANYLGAVVVECAGAELPPYYKYLLQMREQYPIISYQTITEISGEDLIKGYRMLQYNQLMEKDYLKELFSVSP